MPNKLRNIRCRRPAVDFPGRRNLLEPSALEERDPIRHHHRLFLIVRDKYESDPNFPLQSLQFNLHLPSQVGIESRERLV